MFLSVLAWLYKVQRLRWAVFRECQAMHVPSGSGTVPIAPSNSTLCPPLPRTQAPPWSWTTLLLLVHFAGGAPSPSPSSRMSPCACPSSSPAGRFHGPCSAHMPLAPASHRVIAVLCVIAGVHICVLSGSKYWAGSFSG